MSLLILRKYDINRVFFGFLMSLPSPSITFVWMPLSVIDFFLTSCTVVSKLNTKTSSNVYNFVKIAKL